MSRAIWVGVFFFVGMFLLLILCLRVDDEGHIFKGQYKKWYTTVMPSLGTVGKGSIVRMAGSWVRIGRVEKVKLIGMPQEAPEKEKTHFEYLIKFSLKDRVNGLEIQIRKNSVAKLAMTTVLQGMHLEITPGTPDSPVLKNGSNVVSEESASLMDTLAGLGDTFSDLGDGGLGRMVLGKEGLDDLNKAIANLDPTIEAAKGALENVRDATDKESKGTLARILHDVKLGEKVDGVITDLRESMKGVRKFAADISEGKGTIARLASDEELGEKLDGIVTDIKGITGDLRAEKSVLARLISDEQMGTEIKETFTSISKFAKGLAEGEGTIAKLINDPALYDDLRKLLGQTRDAIEDAREAAPISAFTGILFGAF